MSEPNQSRADAPAVKYVVAPVRLENDHYERCQPGEATEWGLYKVMPDGTSAHVHDYATKEEAEAAASCFPTRQAAADSVNKWTPFLPPFEYDSQAGTNASPSIFDGEGEMILTLGYSALAPDEADRIGSRIAALMNLDCAGLNPEAVRPLLEALKRALAAHSIGRTLTVGEWTEARAAIALAERRQP